MKSLNNSSSHNKPGKLSKTSIVFYLKAYKKNKSTNVSMCFTKVRRYYCPNARQIESYMEKQLAETQHQLDFCNP